MEKSIRVHWIRATMISNESCVKIRRKSISFLPLRLLVPFCPPDCLASLFYTNEWERRILHYSSAIVTHLWARKIARRSTNAIKSYYVLMHLEKWAANTVSQFPESTVVFGSPAILLTCPFFVFKRFRRWDQRRHDVCLKIGGVHSSH